MGKRKSTTTTARRAARRRKQKRPYALWVGGGVVLAGLVAALFALARPSSRTVAAMGEAVPVEGANHVPEGTDPGPYNTRPPASGAHYGRPMSAGFYDEDARAQYPYPEGYLVHNLEHGYVVLWYDCAQVAASSCDGLKEMLREVVRASGRYKVIAYPYPGMDVPVVATSWGRQWRLPEPKAEDLKAFVAANRNRAPEPNAP